MTVADLSYAAETRELEPTEPDANGDRWRRYEMTGRCRWSCGCGAASGWVPAQQVPAEVRKHEKSHQEESVDEQYEVIGGAEVAGVAPGGTVTREQIEACGPPGTIHVDALIGVHLRKVEAAPKTTAAKTIKSD